ncbi:MAG: acetamidase/formamidase family protein [Chloroflexota bacterium]
MHIIEPNQLTLHGAFSRDIAPVLTIDSGERVRFRTLDAAWNLEPRTSTHHDQPPSQFWPRPAGQENGHALCGPVAIRDAEPGMTLAIAIEAIRPGPWGFTHVGGWSHTVNGRLGVETEGTYLLWTLDPDTMQGTNQFGQSLSLRPFMGVMGMPPAEPGLHSTVPPRRTGGNLDCKELVVGSTLYLPIEVVGGLFSVGDGHGRQGDGEVCVTAIECPMEQVDLTFHLHSNLQITTPRANTPIGWITFGLHEDLNEATLIALESMVELMVEKFTLNRHQAFGLASVVVDMRITQIVNKVRGVHAVLSHEAIRELGLEK